MPDLGISVRMSLTTMRVRRNCSTNGELHRGIAGTCWWRVWNAVPSGFLIEAVNTSECFEGMVVNNLGDVLTIFAGVSGLVIIRVLLFVQFHDLNVSKLTKVAIKIKHRLYM